MTTRTVDAGPGGPGGRTLVRSPNPVLAVLTVMSVLGALQSSVVVPLVAHIPEIFKVSAAEASWIVTSTVLGASIAAPVVARMADIFGKRLIIVVTLLVIAFGSLLVAVSDTFVVAVAGRALQGCAMALTPVAMSIAKDVLPPERVNSGIALLSGTMGLGSALGLPAAGLLYWLWGWHALFWVTVVLAPLLAVASWRLLPASPPAARQRFDVFGAVLLVFVLTPLLLVVSQGEDWGWTSPAALIMLAVSAAATAVWVPWQLRARTPLVDLRLAVSRRVVLTNLATAAIAGGMLANVYLASQQLGIPRGVPGGLGLSSEMVGVVMIAPALVLIVMAPILGPLLTRFGGRGVMLSGALVMAAAYVARIWLDGSAFAVGLGAVLVGVGISLGLVAQPMIIMAAVPADYTASANGVNSLFRTVGTALSVAAIAAVTSATSTRFEGAEYATSDTFHLAFIGCAVLMLLSALLTLLVPRGSSRADPLRSY